MSIKISNNDKVVIISNLATMLTAGIPIIEAIEALRDEFLGSSRKLLSKIYDSISEGKTLSDALAAQSQVFDPITVSIVKAGEQSGSLDKAFKKVETYQKRQNEFNSKIGAAFIYPAVIGVMFFVVMLIFITFVIPRVAEVFTNLKMELPPVTRLMVAISDFVLTKTYLAAGIFFGSILIVVLLLKFKRAFFLNILFSLPLISKLVIQIDLAKFTSSMSMLLSSGVPITQALEYASKSLTRKKVIKAIQTGKEFVSEGKNLSEGLRENKKVIPGFMIRVLGAGEKSGTLELSMEQVSEYFENQVNITLKNILTLAEPLILVVVGITVGGVMLSIVTPIYQLIGNIAPY